MHALHIIIGREINDIIPCAGADGCRDQGGNFAIGLGSVLHTGTDPRRHADAKAFGVVGRGQLHGLRPLAASQHVHEIIKWLQGGGKQHRRAGAPQGAMQNTCGIQTKQLQGKRAVLQLDIGKKTVVVIIAKPAEAAQKCRKLSDFRRQGVLLVLFEERIQRPLALQGLLGKILQRCAIEIIAAFGAVLVLFTVLCAKRAKAVHGHQIPAKLLFQLAILSGIQLGIRRLKGRDAKPCRVHISGAVGQVMRLVNKEHVFPSLPLLRVKITAQIYVGREGVVVVANDDLAALGKIKR